MKNIGDKIDLFLSVFRFTASEKNNSTKIDKNRKFDQKMKFSTFHIFNPCRKKIILVGNLKKWQKFSLVNFIEFVDFVDFVKCLEKTIFSALTKISILSDILLSASCELAFYSIHSFCCVYIVNRRKTAIKKNWRNKK